MSDTVMHVDICICTYKREQIADTFRSLSNMSTPDNVKFSIIVADNDGIDSARDRIISEAGKYGLNITYVHAPARNISIARNACLDTVTAPVAIFIDDDERVSKYWLTAMLDHYRSTKAPIILGPVQAIYAEHHPQWMKDNDFHSINPVWVNGEIITGYTSNLLLDQSVSDIKTMRFDVALGTSGGEDSAFLSALHKKGHKIEFAKDAVVTEDVTEKRATYKWLFNRRFRMGQTHLRMVLSRSENSLSTRIKTFFIANLKALFCLSVACAFFWNKEKYTFWSLRAALHMGAVMACLGFKDLTLYG